MQRRHLAALHKEWDGLFSSWSSQAYLLSKPRSASHGMHKKACLRRTSSASKMLATSSNSWSHCACPAGLPFTICKRKCAVDGIGWGQAGASMLPLQRLPAPSTVVSVATTASAAQWHTHATCLVRRLCSRLPGAAQQPGAAHAPAAPAAPASACPAPRDTAAAAGRDMAGWPLATCVGIGTRREHKWHRHSSQPWRPSSQLCGAMGAGGIDMLACCRPSVLPFGRSAYCASAMTPNANSGASSAAMAAANRAAARG